MAAPSDTSAGFSSALGRVRLVALSTLIEALRLRLTILLAVAGGALVLLAVGLRDFNFGAAELKFIADFGLGAIGLLGVVLAATGMAHLYFRDVDGGMATVVLTRAVRRGEYLAGKWLGAVALLALFVTALALLLGGVVALRAAQLGVAGIPVALLLQAGALVWLKLALVAAMTLLVCSYAASELFASCAGIMLAVAAHLRPFTRADGWLAWLRMWPNLGLFDAGAVLGGASLGLPAMLGLISYWAAFVALFGILAAYVFQRREF